MAKSSQRAIDVPFWPWGLLIILVGLYVVGVAALIAAGRREDARALAGFIPDCVVLVSRLARERRISPVRRAVLWLVLVYLSLPIDLVPDFLPGIGQLDDAVLLGLALRLLVHGGGSEIVREAWPGPQASLAIVLRAAGLEANGAASRRTTL
ncbi:MAG: YkvA family protein [Solirubrobacterales bacterium]|nr:YkvA family protein [Solirubrobacterales bacterium]